MQTESQSGLYSDRNLLKAACKYPELRLQLCTGHPSIVIQEGSVEVLEPGIGLQVMQQLCGINTVMYYTPTILEIAGFVDKRQALFLSILPAFVNSVGTAIGMWYIPLLLELSEFRFQGASTVTVGESCCSAAWVLCLDRCC